MWNLVRTATTSLATATLVAATSSVSAETVTFDVTGTVGWPSHDTSALFFPQPRATLDGEAFMAHFVFDLTIGDRATGLFSDEIVGGPQVGKPNPLLSASMTMNGHTEAFPLNGWAYLLVQHGTHGDPSFKDFQLVVEFYDPPLRDDQFRLALGSTDFGLLLDQPFHVSNPSGGGQFRFRTDDRLQATFVKFAEGVFTVTDVTASVEGGGTVPEPLSAALVISGLAALGAAGARRHRHRC